MVGRGGSLKLYARLAGKKNKTNNNNNKYLEVAIAFFPTQYFRACALIRGETDPEAELVFKVMRRTNYCERAFCYSKALVWNSSPGSIGTSNSLDI